MRQKRAAPAFVFGIVILLLGLTAAFFYVDSERRYYKGFHYDLRTDYVYAFPKGSAFPAAVEKDGFVWPGGSSLRPDTALLKVRIKTSWSSVFFLPYIEASYRGTAVRQYFEKTGSGVRYFNLSRLVQSLPSITPGETVSLKGSHLSWEIGPSELYLFQNVDSERARILVLSPHPDDAELAAFGFYQNRDAYVVTITAGEGGKLKLKNFTRDLQKHAFFQGTVRTWDSITIPFWAGITAKRCINLGYFDSTLRAMFEKPSQKIPSTVLGTADLRTFRKHNISDLIDSNAGESTWESLVNDLAQILLEVRPSIIVTPNPVTEDHPDHQFTTIALCEALKKVPSGQELLYLYNVHDRYSSRWPFGPRSSALSLPPSFDPTPYFEKVFAHRLSEETIMRKLFALNDMHDLRPIFFLKPEQYTNLLLGLWQSVYLQWKSTRFIRKWMREDEFFLVLSAKQASNLSEAFERSLGVTV